jgi:hypothetical protein
LYGSALTRSLRAEGQSERPLKNGAGLYNLQI